MSSRQAVTRVVPTSITDLSIPTLHERPLKAVRAQTLRCSEAQDAASSIEYCISGSAEKLWEGYLSLRETEGADRGHRRACATTYDRFIVNDRWKFRRPGGPDSGYPKAMSRDAVDERRGLSVPRMLCTTIVLHSGGHELQCE